MKRLLSLILTAVLVLGSVCTALADSDISVTLDGNALSFDVPPQIVDGRTLVPLRVIFEALGAQVDWNDETKTVTAASSDTTVKMTIGSYEMYVNDEEITLDVPPQIIDGRTLVPARAVAEGFGAQVGWDEVQRAVTITTPVKYEIRYDDTAERQASYMRDFQIKSITMNENGDFDIVYTLRTFMEGHGIVSVEFNCLDDDGTVVDYFSGSFLGSDYAWVNWEESVTISGKTTEIQFLLKK